MIEPKVFKIVRVYFMNMRNMVNCLESGYEVFMYFNIPGQKLVQEIVFRHASQMKICAFNGTLSLTMLSNVERGSHVA